MTLVILLLIGLVTAQVLLWRSLIRLEERMTERVEASTAATRYALSQGADRAVDAAKGVFLSEHQEALRQKIAKARAARRGGVHG
jgi:uncharacterized membrane protein YcjF (UPF0283 family)